MYLTRSLILGQSVFGADVYQLLKVQGHEVVGVFTIPDDKNNGKPDPLAVAAAADSVPVFKFPRWRKKVDGVFTVRIKNSSIITESYPTFCQLEHYNIFR